MSNTNQSSTSDQQQTQTGLDAYLDPVFNIIGGLAGISASGGMSTMLSGIFK
jgi:hypothetical protein